MKIIDFVLNLLKTLSFALLSIISFTLYCSSKLFGNLINQRISDYLILIFL